MPWVPALALFLILAAYQWSFGFGMGAGDYAQYFSHAMALVHGRPYTDIGYIFTSYNPWVGPRAEPPGLPLTLYPIFALFGPNMVLVRLLMIASALAFVLLAARYFALRSGVWVGAAVAAITGVSFEALYATSGVFSDLAFGAFIWAVILLADGSEEWTGRRIAGITLLGLGAVAYRTAGAAIVPAMVLFAIVNRGALGRRALIPAVLWAIIGITAAAMLGTLQSFESVLSLRPQSILWNIRMSASVYPYGIFEASLYPFGSSVLNAAYHLLVIALLALGLIPWLWHRRRSFLAALIVAYCAMLLLMPMIETRYLWPLFPLVAFGIVNAVRILAAAAWPSASFPADRIAFVTAITIATVAAVMHVSQPRREGLVEQPEVRDLFAWVSSVKAQSPRVMFSNPRVLTWETGVPAMSTFKASVPESLAELRRQRITHVVVGDMGVDPALNDSVRGLVAASPDRFTLVYKNPAFSVFKVKPW